MLWRGDGTDGETQAPRWKEDCAPVCPSAPLSTPLHVPPCPFAPWWSHSRQGCRSCSELLPVVLMTLEEESGH